MPSDPISDFCRGQRLTWKLLCPYCQASGMDLKVLKGQSRTVTGYDSNRHYQRMRCLVCDKLFIYWYDKRKVNANQLKLPEIDSVEKVEIKTEEEKLEQWLK